MVRSFEPDMSAEREEEVLQRMFDWLDVDNSGKVTYHEFKVCMMRAFVNR